jgi:glycosyltransferase involved in cell wall biosynthesis
MISVIIPVYNTKDYLKKCIQSIIEQQYSDWELILVDDGSDDGSEQICDYFANCNSKIRVVHNPNQGPAASRKCGLGIARGEFIMFVDADDWVDYDIMTILESEMAETHSDIVMCSYVDVYPKGKKVMHQPFDLEAIEYKDFSQSVHEIHGTRNIATGPWAKLYRRELFENVDFRENITIGEDYTMLLQVLRNANKVRIIRKVLYNRRMFGGNISRSGYTRRHRFALDNYIEVRNGLIEAFPQYRIEILGYHIEYEMAVITAMCRNRNYDRPVIKRLQEDLKQNMDDIIKKCNISLYMKICAFMIAHTPYLFIALFRVLHMLTGR